MADSLSNKNLSSHPRQIMKLISTAISELQNNGVYWVTEFLGIPVLKQ